MKHSHLPSALLGVNGCVTKAAFLVPALREYDKVFQKEEETDT